MTDRENDIEPYEAVAKGLNSPEIRSNSNIPFADEAVELENVNDPIRPQRFKDVEKGEPENPKIHASDLGSVHTPNSDTIVVDTPEGTLYITLDPDSSKSSKPTSPSTQSTDLSTPSTSKAFGAEESDALITSESEVEQRKTNLRRNSISMPNIELLRQDYLNNTQGNHKISTSTYSVNNVLLFI
ncbi:unnamed protein product [Pieris macdunnoughi]|uniref:Uncharacterized protein n=1 Tax=Pieris macdunnoughi TaxID=345717 RepID=A0A821STI0_9NEOP|nr:unnamed protein product [Pieris macdunnoughi]